MLGGGKKSVQFPYPHPPSDGSSFATRPPARADAMPRGGGEEKNIFADNLRYAEEETVFLVLLQKPKGASTLSLFDNPKKPFPLPTIAPPTLALLAY